MIFKIERTLLEHDTGRSGRVPLIVVLRYRTCTGLSFVQEGMCRCHVSAFGLTYPSLTSDRDILRLNTS